MATNNTSALLTSLDTLFTTQEERDNANRSYVTDLPISEISNFPNHPFKIRMDESMDDLVRSVSERGVVAPAIVRPKADGGYEMVSGHRRKRACELAGIDTIPCIVKDLTDDEATIIMVDANLQREKVLPSEKAFAYKMKFDAIKRQGKQTSQTLSPVATKLDTAAILGKQNGESRDQVFRYIRLTHLLPALLDMVDEGKIAMRPAVELSYLSETEQTALQETIISEDRTPSHAQAIKMRKFSAEGKLNADVILSIMQEEKPNQVEQVRIPRSRVAKYFPAGTPVQKMEDIIIKALEMYRRRQRDMER